MTDNTGVERDYSGVPTAELAVVYNRLADCDIRTFADRIEMDERDLKKVVLTQNYPFTGLLVADKIVSGLGENLGSLIEHGELHVIPARGSRNAARKMIEDEFWVKDLPPPSGEEMDRRIDGLLALAAELATPSEAQRERLRRDSERSSIRLARMREEGKAAAA